MRQARGAEWQIELRPLRPGAPPVSPDASSGAVPAGQLSPQQALVIEARLAEIVTRLDELGAAIERLGQRVEAIAVARPRPAPRPRRQPVVPLEGTAPDPAGGA
ncbi:MAG TPA: hypothetical protein VHB69_11315 [Mycobacteriales bacterium]|nr:hypothetical protein [Mycobacteriales bacterium]